MTQNLHGAYAPHLSPSGHLHWVMDPERPALPSLVHKRLEQVFKVGGAQALLNLGVGEVNTALSGPMAWWRGFASYFLTTVCTHAQSENPQFPSPQRHQLLTLLNHAPPMVGSEYLSVETLEQLWQDMDAALHAELAQNQWSLEDYLKARHSAWNLVGRVCFNLAENRKDEEFPFAFLATYTPRLSAQGRIQHLPLKQALSEYAGAKNKQQLLSLLLPVQRASQDCAWLKAMVSSGEIYHPLRWRAKEAWAFLSDFQKLESSGIMVRAPLSWKSTRPARPQIKSTIGSKAPSLLGADALLDFKMEIMLDGDKLTAAEVKALLKNAEGLQFLRGKWIEVNHQKLSELLTRFEGIEKTAGKDGLDFTQAMRLMAGASLDHPFDPEDVAWMQIDAGPWFSELLDSMREPGGLQQINPGADLKTPLRPYQQDGLRWLYLLSRLRLGACLADDMGLGKTIQILALLLVLKKQGTLSSKPVLLVVPASLLANWMAEAHRFAPSLRLLIVHPSALSVQEMQSLGPEQLQNHDLVITSYGTLLRWSGAQDFFWQMIILDEAQSIKNPNAKQSQKVKQLQATSRIALTGTPVENRLSDLWSIFDFTHPGLLGSAKTFAGFVKELSTQENFSPLRNLVRPYILRRMKTDKRIIADLPDKTEIKAWCHLSPTQATLYETAVNDLAKALGESTGIARKGLVLSSLMKFKQICNHSSQWLSDGDWREENSGKFSRLRELAEVIGAKQEKLLVFTQFREATEPLASFLGDVFGRPGLVLHGGTPVAKRRSLVDQFQNDEMTPFFVLSIKAGGSGLNLTAASHVIHFDRWWNPSVENQATDRAFRIGQKRNVLVHKFICKGTIEEKIDQLIESKQSLVSDILQGESELSLTEMSNEELLNLVKLDINAARAQ
jgi:non-specific serine/threonine protein kinase